MTIKVEEQLFPQRQQILANYDYYDIAEGIGYQVYYGSKGDAQEYFVTPYPTYSEETQTIDFDANLTTSYVAKFDVDFDITYNYPKFIKGIALANVPIGMRYNSSIAHEGYMYCVVRAYHYDGVTETLLATGTSRVVHDNLDTDNQYGLGQVALCKLDISAGRRFKRGETLRFNVRVFYKDADGPSSDWDIAFGHDPEGRDNWDGIMGPPDIDGWPVMFNSSSGGSGDYPIPTKLKFYVPYRIDL